MCYKRHIKDIVADVIEIVEQIVYDKFQWNLTYKLFLQGYSSALIEYQFMDPTIPHHWHYCGLLQDPYSCEAEYTEGHGYVCNFKRSFIVN